MSGVCCIEVININLNSKVSLIIWSELALISQLIKICHLVYGNCNWDYVLELVDCILLKSYYLLFMLFIIVFIMPYHS